MMKAIQKQVSIFFNIMFMIILCQPFGVIKVQATTVINRTPITCYTTGKGNINTYKAINGAYSGYICSNDKCTILAVYNSGWVKVKYPISKGTKTAYAQSSNFFSNTNFSTSAIKLGKNMTVYRKSNLANSFGTVYGSDSVLITGNSGGNTQILYPISGGYKLGWVRGNYTSSGDVEVNISDGYYQIKSAMNTNYVIDVYGSSKSDSANVQLYQNFYTTNQAFIIKKHSNGYYSISAVHSNKLLDVYECQTQNGANIIQCCNNGGVNQYWKIYRTYDGYYSFKSKLNGLYINVHGGIAENERNIHCYQKNNSLAQKFVLQPVTINGKSYNGGNSANDKKSKLIEIAKSQLGIKERSADSDDIKYNDWYYGQRVINNGKSGEYAWCAVFVSWCAKEAGISENIIPKHCNTTDMKNMLINNGGILHLKGTSYTPVKGDIIFFGFNASRHVGIVDYTSGNTVYYIDGNNIQTTPHGVHYSNCSLTRSDLYGFVTPNY